MEKNQQLLGSPGKIGVLTNSNKLVLVLEKHVKVDMGAISASLDASRFFAYGPTATARSVWHAVRVHHRCRLLFPPESACERLGSELHRQWDDRQHLAPGPLIDRVFLAQAHVTCVGGERDELLVQAVAQLMRLHIGRRAQKRKRSSGATEDSVQHIKRLRDALRASGREFRGCIGEWSVQESQDCLFGDLARFGKTAEQLRTLRSSRLKQSLPATVPSELLVAARRTARDGNTLAALPVCAASSRLASKSAAASVMQRHLEEWLGTEAGRAWKADRKRTYGQGSDTESESGAGGMSPRSPQ